MICPVRESNLKSDGTTPGGRCRADGGTSGCATYPTRTELNWSAGYWLSKRYLYVMFVEVRERGKGKERERVCLSRTYL